MPTRWWYPHGGHEIVAVLFLAGLRFNRTLFVSIRHSLSLGCMSCTELSASCVQLVPTAMLAVPTAILTAAPTGGHPDGLRTWVSLKDYWQKMFRPHLDFAIISDAMTSSLGAVWGYLEGKRPEGL